LRKKLEGGRENAYLSQKLAAIVTDLDVPLDLEKARPGNFNPQAVHAAFRELEFRTLLKRLEALEEQYGKVTPRPGQQLQLFGEVPPQKVERSAPKEPKLKVLTVTPVEDWP